MEFKPYSKGAPCVKCGTTAPYSEYVPRHQVLDASVGVTEIPKEHMIRTCRHCKYSWKENTADDRT